MFRRTPLERRALILAPIGRDAGLLANSLAVQGIETAIAANAETLLSQLADGAGCVLIAEEALGPDAIIGLESWLVAQPPWSDMPLVVLTSNAAPSRQSRDKVRDLQALGNFTLLERPLHPVTVQSSVRAALRARMRQYEMRSRQEALVQANADLEEFAHSASHDLREPLRSIGIYSDLLNRECGASLNERGVEFLTQIQSGASRMDALLSDLLSYARASIISEEPVEPVPARHSIDIALENLAAAISESNARITIGGMPTVKMRESHLSQLFQNLIGNALKYRKATDAPAVSVSANEADGHWTFTVSDNGIGVPAQYKESIFGIFKRLHTNTSYSGTGMGLAICQRIVERYRGRIWVESIPGEGADFHFRIPA